MTKLTATETEYWNRHSGNPLSESEIEMAQEIAEAHALDGLSSKQITDMAHIARYVAAVDSLLNVYRKINLVSDNDLDLLDPLLEQAVQIHDAVLSQRDLLETLLTNAGHQIMPADFEHDLIVKFSNEFGQIVKLTWFNR